MKLLVCISNGGWKARNRKFSAKAMLSRLLSTYSACLRDYPFHTQVITSGALWFCGDRVAQRVALASCTDPSTTQTRTGPASEPAFDIRRSSYNAVYGGIVNGIFGHVWYRELDAWAQRTIGDKPQSCSMAGPSMGPPKNVASWRVVGTKVVCDAAIFGPAHVAGYLLVMSLLEGSSFSMSMDTVKNKFLDAYLVECAAWSTVQAVNFRFVPVRYQLLVVNLVTVADAAFMSWWKNR
jgi:protein Mpv17